MSYLIDELNFRKGDEDELNRVISILADILKRILNDKKITEHEKYFFCSAGIKLALVPGKLGDYECSNNYTFTDIYLSYWYDLDGNSSYTKMKKGVEYTPSNSEVKRDVKYLVLESKKWEKVIKKENHSNQLLQEVSKECRKDLKSLSKSIGRLYFQRQKEEYRLFKLKILLQSKNTYCRALLVLEKFREKALTLFLNGEIIVINEYSVVHILNRHYAEMTKHKPNKSFHNEDFEPDYLDIQLFEIFEKIENSQVLRDHKISELVFTYNRIIYKIWIKRKITAKKGDGVTEYQRLESFYPLEDKSELKELERNYHLKTITNNLEIYLKN